MSVLPKGKWKLVNNTDLIAEARKGGHGRKWLERALADALQLAEAQLERYRGADADHALGIDHRRDN